MPDPADTPEQDNFFPALPDATPFPPTIMPNHAGMLGFPAMLPFELAMRTAPPDEICAAYNIAYDDFVELCANPTFQKAFEIAQEEVAKNGVSFRIKAHLQAEELLKTSWNLIHSAATPSAVKADLIKSTVRWAHLEPSKTDGAGGGNTNAFQININLK